jgi:hypothetical protein
MMPLLSAQFFSFYSRMDDGQKNTIDLCTRQYIENIITMRPELNKGIDGLKKLNISQWNRQSEILDKAKVLIDGFLQGGYRFDGGSEVLILPNGKSISINNISSGQQESLWLLNFLIYYMVKGNNTFFIIEEPESNLFPEWQKKVVEFITLAHNAGNQMLITTHSPYALAAINNIRYASQLRGKNSATVDKIIPTEYNINELSAYFVSKGEVKSCIDTDTGLIDTALIDEIAGELNEDIDSLIEIDTQRAE